jgi:OFA family oxalate/formate antiporter-like MFS transporter
MMYTLKEALVSWPWYGLWAALFLNTTAGIAIISQAAPMAEEITGVSAAVAAGLVGAISIANGVGRFLWASLSDVIGRRRVFLIMFPLQGLLFAALPAVESFPAFTVVACAILLCYGGGFGTMPAFAADRFGTENIGSIYGLMLTAWSFAGVLGPMLIAALREQTGQYGDALYVIAGLMFVSTIIPVLLGRPERPAPVASTIPAKTA